MGLTQTVEVPPKTVEEAAAVCAANAGVIATSTSSICLTEICKFERVQRRAMKMLKGQTACLGVKRPQGLLLVYPRTLV